MQKVLKFDKKPYSPAFTIVELLVVIVVIGILAAITIVSYTGISQRARDSARDSAVNQIKQAIEVYTVQTGHVPITCTNTTDATNCDLAISDSGGLISILVPNYVSSLPNDSLSPTRIIRYYSSHGNGYDMLIQYETKSICKTGSNSSAGDWGVSVPFCS